MHKINHDDKLTSFTKWEKKQKLLEIFHTAIASFFILPSDIHLLRIILNHLL